MGSLDTEHGQLELLDLSSWTWETRRSYYIEVHGFATLTFDGNMYVFGGRSFKQSKALDTIRSYNPETDTWTDRGRLLKTHWYHDVIFLSGSFLVLGDNDNHKSEKCVLDGNSFICEEQQTIFGSVD